MKKTTTFSSFIGCLAVLILLFGNVFGGTVTWTGGGPGTSWSTANNWGGTAPVANDDVVFNTGGTVNVTLVPSIILTSITVSNSTTVNFTSISSASRQIQIKNAFSIASSCALNNNVTLNNLLIVLSDNGSTACSWTNNGSFSSACDFQVNSNGYLSDFTGSGSASFTRKVTFYKDLSATNGSLIIRFPITVTSGLGNVLFLNLVGAPAGTNAFEIRNNLSFAGYCEFRENTVVKFISGNVTGGNLQLYIQTSTYYATPKVYFENSAVTVNNINYQNFPGTIDFNLSSGSTITVNGTLSIASINGTVSGTALLSMSGVSNTLNFNGSSNNIDMTQFFAGQAVTSQILMGGSNNNLIIGGNLTLDVYSASKYSKLTIGGTNNTVTVGMAVNNTNSTAANSIIEFTTASGTLNIGGDFTSNGTFTAGTVGFGTVVLNGTSTQNINGALNSSNSFNNLTIANTAANVNVVAGATVDVTGTMTVNSGATFVPDATIIINSASQQGTITGSGTIHVTRTTGTPDYPNQYKFTTNSLSTMTVDYAGTTNQNINHSTTIGNLITSGGGTKTLVASLTTNPTATTGNVTIGASTALDVSASNYPLSVGGNWTNNNSFNSRAGTTTFTSTSGVKAITGNLTGANSFYNMVFNGSGGAWSFSGNADVNNNFTITNGTVTAPSALSVGGSWSNNGAFANNSGTVSFTSTASGKTISGNLTGSNKFNDIIFNGIGGGWSFSSDADVNNNFTITNGAVTAPVGNLSVGGNWANNGAFSDNSGTVIFTSTTSGKTIAGNLTGSNKFYKVILNGIGGGWTFTNNADVYDDFLIINGTVTAPAALSVGGSWSNAGTFTHNSGTVTFTATTLDKTIAGNLTGINAFYNIIFNGIGGKWSLSNNVSVSTDLTITNGVLDGQSAIIYLAGNWTNNGTFTKSSSTLELVGGTSQSINGASANDFYNFAINNSAVVKNTISIPTSVSNVLTLSNGKLVTTGTNILTMTSTATINGSPAPSDNSFIYGPVAKVIASNSSLGFTFPVGKDSAGSYSEYLPIGISGFSGSGTNVTFTAELMKRKIDYRNVRDTDMTGAPLFSLPVNPYDTTVYYRSNLWVDHIDACEYWTLTQASGNLNAKITLYWNSTYCVVSNPATLRVLTANTGATSWDDIDPSANTPTYSGTNSSGYVTSYNTSNYYNAFTLGSTNNQNPLPVSLLSFTAKPRQHDILVEWSTATEVNSKEFIVEKEVAGMSNQIMSPFTPMATVPGAGNSTSERKYQVIDDSPFQPKQRWNYYRLKQVDIDDKYKYYGPVAVQLKGMPDASIYPSISSGRFFYTGDLKNAEVTVYSTDGRKVFYTTAADDSFDISSLSEGVYFVTVRSNEGVVQNRIIKTN